MFTCLYTAVTSNGLGSEEKFAVFSVIFIGNFMDNFQQIFPNRNIFSYPCGFSGRN